MTYWLEKRIVQKKGKSSQITWKRYAVCGSPGLLERVRTGQEHPEHWRVSLEIAGAAPLTSMKKAG